MNLIQKDVLLRLKETMDFRQEKELADFLEISQQSLVTIKKRGTIPYKKIIEKNIGNYNLEYIFTGNSKTSYLENELEIIKDIDNFELFLLIQNYAPKTMKEDIKTNLIKLKEFQENLQGVHNV
jgi:type III secretory pathway component EscR